MATYVPTYTYTSKNIYDSGIFRNWKLHHRFQKPVAPTCVWAWTHVHNGNSWLHCCWTFVVVGFVGCTSVVDHLLSLDIICWTCCPAVTQTPIWTYRHTQTQVQTHPQTQTPQTPTQRQADTGTDTNTDTHTNTDTSTGTSTHNDRPTCRHRHWHRQTYNRHRHTTEQRKTMVDHSIL